MGTVVFTGVDAPLVESLRNKQTLARTRFEEIGDAELALERLGGDEIDAVVIGAGVVEAMRLAQRAHAKDRDLAVLLVAAQGAAGELASALRFAPSLGPEVSWCERSPAELVERALSLAVERTQKRRDYRAALLPWRRKAPSAPSRPLRPESLLERLLVQLPLGVLLVDSAGTVTAVNRRACELFAKAERELTGARLAALVPARAVGSVDDLLEAGGAGDGSARVTFEIECSAARSFIELSAAPVVAPSSQAGVLVLVSDVSERERATREKEQLRAEIESSQRLASLGLLAAGVGHEINNPLTYVMGNVQYVLDRLVERSSEGGKTDELVQLLRDALEGAGRIRSVVRDLRTFSRLESEEHGAVDMAEVVDSALAIVTNELKHRARVVKRYAAVAPVRGHSSRLGQVFLNLLTNAAQAIPAGHAASNEVRIDIEPGSESSVVVTIRDSGEGISPEVIGKIFDPFFTTKPVGQGTGLGLSICQRIVAEHEGTLEVESRRGEGATFRVSLPAMAVAPNAVSRPVPPADTETKAERASVLVVDDELGVLRIATLVLGDDHDVSVVRSGEAALAKIQAGERFDVIFCDMMMPTMAGPEVYERLRAIDEEQAARVVFMSGGVFSLEARAVLERLPNERLDKPFRAETLHALVRSVRDAARERANAVRSPRRTRRG
jgi:PAS domain S-box-containing protein